MKSTWYWLNICEHTQVVVFIEHITSANILFHKILIKTLC